MIANCIATDQRDNLLNVLNVQIATYWRNCSYEHKTSVWLCRIPHRPTYALLRRIAPSSVVCRSVCRSVSLSH